MVLKWLFNLIGDSDDKKLKALTPLVERINSLEPELKKLSDEALRAKTASFKKSLSEGQTLDDILPEAFAAVREASVRTTGLRHFDVQLLGGIVLHQGKIAEMKTGEGKTLAATLAIYLNALAGKGSHVVTVNDYLAKRDSEWMGPIYQFLGLEVGVIQHWMEPEDRQKAYAADVTYGTNNEFGFDHLRDNMSLSLEQCVQRPLHFAIVDEVDSILVDEARTPLIISGMVEGSLQSYQQADQIAKKLVLSSDFTTDEKTKNAVLSEMGVKKLERLLGIDYLFDIDHMDLAHQIIQSLRARHCFEKNVDYVIKDGEVLIVDEFTGRLMQGRRYSDGLHQAIEAKESVEIRHEAQTLATITFQNYFRLYNKLAGMTGTAKTEEGEFWRIYGLEVLVIPTHKPMVRNNLPDVIYKNKRAKFKAVADEIADWHKKGRPLLVGTISIENSELLAQMLKRRGIAHRVLNAKQHEREAEIISQAGQKGMVTISTNMAGRGTDIVLGDGVVDLGGLHVIGTERHESRRIDNQLRGRAGRQGDPGSSRFYVSLEDDLMRLFGSQRISTMMDRFKIEEDTPIEHRMISNMIERAQKKVEEYHFGIRKQVLEYDDVMNRQRETIYALRRRILGGQDLKTKALEMIEQVANDNVNNFLSDKTHPDEWDYDGLISAVNEIVPVSGIEAIKTEKEKKPIINSLIVTLKQAYDNREAEVGPEQMREIERLVMLRVIDSAWIDQLHNMDNLREGIGLRGMGGRDPLVEYKIEGYTMFQEMMRGVREQIIGMIFKVQLVPSDSELRRGGVEGPKPRVVSYGAPSRETAKPAAVKKVSIGRNDPCPCGSGKKYKKCCLPKEG
ncbi:MAG: preprotein translocase subunit SecA [Candidatus Margulisbacteria bacterium]|nr:preprotein translocase subunit SecA [Candidatus Margulisiibacteriota bacterium]